MKKKLLALTLALVMVAALLAGCGDANNSSNTGNTGATDPGTSNAGGNSGNSQGGAPALPGNADLVSGEQENTNYVRPSLAFDAGMSIMLNPAGHRDHGPVAYSIYEMLFAVENGVGSNLVPWLADANRGGNNAWGVKGMDHEDGSTEYLFYIYDYITDSAGNKITADDVVFSFERAASSGQATGWGDIVGWEAVDATTVKMTTKRDLTQKGELENIILRCMIYSEKAFNDSPSGFTADACGTGRYVIADYAADAYVVCKARDDYWQTNEELIPRIAQANVAEFTAMVVSDDNSRIVSLQSGDLDMLSQISTSSAGTFLNDSKYEIYSYMQNGVHFLEANCSEESIMSDLNMRLAVFYAINNTGLASILNATGVEAYQPLYAFGFDMFSDYLTKWDSEDNYVTQQNLELSKQYAEAAGYKGETLYFLNASDTTGIVENVMNMLLNAGFNVELKSYDRNTTTTVQDDPTQWDIFYSNTNSSDFTTSLWSHVMDPNMKGGRTENYIVDQDYFDLLSTALVVGSSDDDLDAFWQYTVENGYICPLVHGINSMILPAGQITSIYQNDKNHFIPGAAYYVEG